MTTPRLRNRAQVKLRLIEVAAYALTDLELYEDRTETVPVNGTWDGTTIPTTGLYVGQSVGRSDRSDISRNGFVLDVFDVQCQIYVAGSPNWSVAELAAEVVFNAFDSTLRSLVGLAEQGTSDIPTANPPVSAMEPAPWSVEYARTTDSVGPYHTFPEPRGTKAIPGVYDFTVACATSLR